MKAKIIQNSLLVIALMATLVVLEQGCRIKKLKKANELQAVEIMTAKDSVISLRTKKGELYFKLNAATVDAKFLKSALDQSGFEIKELKDRGIAVNKVVSTLKMQLSLSGRDTIPLRDTVINVVNGLALPAQSFNWTNNYLTLSGVIVNKKYEMYYSYKTDLTLITSRNKKQTIVTGYFTDPNARIVTGSSIVVIHYKKWYEKQWLWGLAGAGIGLYLGK